MQDYIEIAAKNGIILMDTGSCQFCGAHTVRGVHECLEIFSLGFQELDFSLAENHIYRFYIVDAHTLQHPELHGRWNNHFHLTRLHLIFHYNVKWNYALSPKLSDYLNKYKVNHPKEIIQAPPLLERGQITSTDIKANSDNQPQLKILIEEWAKTVYAAWREHHSLVDKIAQGFVQRTYNS